MSKGESRFVKGHGVDQEHLNTDMVKGKVKRWAAGSQGRGLIVPGD